MKINSYKQGVKHDVPKKTSEFVGVFWHKYAGKWCAKLTHERRSYYLGYFDCEVEAARKYDHHVRSLFGDDAKTNFSNLES